MKLHFLALEPHVCERCARLMMNLPNQLTIFRLILAAIFVMANELAIPYGATLAAAAFGAAVLTDYLDGVIARRMGCETDFGKLMDPLADKVLIAAALVCLVASGEIPAWAAIVLIARDFLITGLRQLALSNGIVLAADPSGKTKTASQMLMIGFFLILNAAGDWSAVKPHMTLYSTIGQLLVVLSVLLSIFSGWNYTRKHWSSVMTSGQS